MAPRLSIGRWRGDLSESDESIDYYSRRVLLQDAPQAPFAQKDDMVGALATDRSGSASRRRCSARRTRGDGLVPGCPWLAVDVRRRHRKSGPDRGSGAGSVIPGECLRDLARNPFRGRICCDVNPDKVSTRQPDDDEGIEQTEANSRN